MSCITTLTGLPLTCDDSIGGVKNLWIKNINEVSSIEIQDLEVVDMVFTNNIAPTPIPSIELNNIQGDYNIWVTISNITRVGTKATFNIITTDNMFELKPDQPFLLFGENGNTRYQYKIYPENIISLGIDILTVTIEDPNADINNSYSYILHQNIGLNLSYGTTATEYANFFDNTNEISIIYGNTLNSVINYTEPIELQFENLSEPSYHQFTPINVFYDSYNSGMDQDFFPSLNTVKMKFSVEDYNSIKNLFNIAGNNNYLFSVYNVNDYKYSLFGTTYGNNGNPTIGDNDGKLYWYVIPEELVNVYTDFNVRAYFYNYVTKELITEDFVGTESVGYSQIGQKEINIISEDFSGLILNTGVDSALYTAMTDWITEPTIFWTEILENEPTNIGKFSKYSFKRGNCSFTTTQTHDDKLSTNFYTSEILVSFNKMEKLKRSELTQLSKSQNYVILEDWNGIFWFFGYDSYVTGNVVGNTGSEWSDGSQYQLTLSSMTKQLPYTIKWNSTFLQNDTLD